MADKDKKISCIKIGDDTYGIAVDPQINKEYNGENVDYTVTLERGVKLENDKVVPIITTYLANGQQTGGDTQTPPEELPTSMDDVLYYTHENGSEATSLRQIVSTFSMDLKTTGAIGDKATVFGTENLALGSHSIAEGMHNVVGGPQSRATGNMNVVLGMQSSIEGIRNLSTGQCNHTEGMRNTNEGKNCHIEGVKNWTSTDALNTHVEGARNQVRASQVHCEGMQNVVTGSANRCHVEGSENIATAAHCHVEGYQSKCNGIAGHAEGHATWAYGLHSHAEGSDNANSGTASPLAAKTVEVSSSKSIKIQGSTAYGTGSHAEGVQTLAYGYGSHAEGVGTVAIGNRSHAEGTNCIATGTHSHAGGQLSEARKAYSFAHGDHVYTSYDAQFTVGKYNSTHTSAMFLVGAGTSSQSRSVFAVKNNGDAIIDGGLRLYNNSTTSSVGGPGFSGSASIALTDDIYLTDQQFGGMFGLNGWGIGRHVYDLTNSVDDLTNSVNNIYHPTIYQLPQFNVSSATTTAVTLTFAKVDRILPKGCGWLLVHVNNYAYDTDNNMRQVANATSYHVLINRSSWNGGPTTASRLWFAGEHELLWEPIGDGSTGTLRFNFKGKTIASNSAVMVTLQLLADNLTLESLS